MISNLIKAAKSSKLIAIDLLLAIDEADRRDASEATTKTMRQVRKQSFTQPVGYWTQIKRMDDYINGKRPKPALEPDP